MVQCTSLLDSVIVQLDRSNTPYSTHSFISHTIDAQGFDTQCSTRRYKDAQVIATHNSLTHKRFDAQCEVNAQTVGSRRSERKTKSDDVRNCIHSVRGDRKVWMRVYANSCAA